jgi:anthranilate phosphoribosyltransferase
MFAQKYHTSMKYVGAIRRELGIRTVFNILGPLTNPARPDYMLLGVYSEKLVSPLAKVMMSLGVKRGMVAYGTDHLDEISISAPTMICEFRDGYYRDLVIRPEDFGLTSAAKEEIRGGSPEENAQTVRGILSGSITGARREIVLMNAGAGLFISGKAASFEDGVQRAAELIDSGAALRKVDEMIRVSNCG